MAVDSGRESLRPPRPGSGTTRYEVWRSQYKADRYLCDASTRDLLDRFRYLVNLIAEITPDGKMAARPARDASSLLYIELFQHAATELELRGISANVSTFGLDRHLPSVKWPRRHDGSGWRRVMHGVEATAVIKYGRLEHLQAMLDGKGVRVAPASSYGDVSLGSHRSDDELRREITRSGRGMSVQALREIGGRQFPCGPRVPLDGEMTQYFDAPDYYVWCASQVCDPRLFVDFEADACLVIRDVKAFVDRMAWGIARALLAKPPREMVCSAQPVMYYDPYRMPNDWEMRLDVSMHKPIRYAYQREWRLVTMLAPVREELEVLWVDPGPMGDIAEIRYVGDLVGDGPRRLLPA